MRQVKITGREWDCCSLSYCVRTQIRGHETLTHIFTLRIKDKTDKNNNDRHNTTLTLKRKSKNV